MVNNREAANIFRGESRLEMAALLLVCSVTVVAVLFPENFISGLPFFSTANSYPLTLMLPLMALVTIIYLASRRKYLRPNVVDAFVLLFAGYMLARNLTGPESLITGKYIIYGISTFYITALLTEQKESLLKKIIFTIAGLVLITSIYGLIEYAFQKNLIFSQYVAEAVPEPRIGLHRIGSTLAHPVPFGAFIIQSLPFVILLWVTTGRAWLRATAMATTLLAVLALFFTFSKGSWIVGVIVAAGTLLLLRRKSSRRYIVPAVIIAVMLTVTSGIFWQQVRSEIETRSEMSFDVRIYTWQGAIKGISEYPLFGVGLKQGAAELQKHVDPKTYKDLGNFVAVDNYYLSLLLEAGIAGFVIWMLFILFLLLEGFKAGRSRGPSQPWALAALVSILGITMNAVTFETMHIWPNFILFWISAGILHGLYWGNIGAWKDSGQRWKEQAVPELI